MQPQSNFLVVENSASAAIPHPTLLCEYLSCVLKNPLRPQKTQACSQLHFGTSRYAPKVELVLGYARKTRLRMEHTTTSSVSTCLAVAKHVLTAQGSLPMFQLVMRGQETNPATINLSLIRVFWSEQKLEFNWWSTLFDAGRSSLSGWVMMGITQHIDNKLKEKDSMLLCG